MKDRAAMDTLPNRYRALRALLALGLGAWLALVAPAAAAEPARVVLLGLFHFDNPGFDAVKYRPVDVMAPAVQAEVVAIARRLAAFRPTRVLLEYPAKAEADIAERYARYRAGDDTLPRNEIYQLGFRIARLAGLPRVHGIDVPAPAFGEALWSYLPQVPQRQRELMDLIASESARLQRLHDTRSLAEILWASNTADEDRRNKGFYMLLNDIAAGTGEFHGADASANWWHRNLRMYAAVQMHAQPGERVVVIAGSGHTAVMRDFLRADAARVEQDVLPFLERVAGAPAGRP